MCKVRVTTKNHGKQKRRSRDESPALDHRPQGLTSQPRRRPRGIDPH
nr:MAG TPA: hypothetical protein [Caudoviricetes sp.]